MNYKEDNNIMTTTIQGDFLLTNKCHFNMGKTKNKVAFVFSCPGQDEEKAQKPTAGQTGKNLDALLVYLHRQNSTIFKYTDRYSYRITNAWDKVEFESRTGRTEATKREISAEENLSRVNKELDGMNIVVFFGKKAQRIKKLIDFSGIILTTRHLSFQSLNQITKDRNGITLINKAKNNTEKRLEVLGDEILGQLDKI